MATYDPILREYETGLDTVIRNYPEYSETIQHIQSQTTVIQIMIEIILCITVILLMTIAIHGIQKLSKEAHKYTLWTTALIIAITCLTACTAYTYIKTDNEIMALKIPDIIHESPNETPITWLDDDGNEISNDDTPSQPLTTKAIPTIKSYTIHNALNNTKTIIGRIFILGLPLSIIQTYILKRLCKKLKDKIPAKEFVLMYLSEFIAYVTILNLSSCGDPRSIEPIVFAMILLMPIISTIISAWFTIKAIPTATTMSVAYAIVTNICIPLLLLLLYCAPLAIAWLS